MISVLFSKSDQTGMKSVLDFSREGTILRGKTIYFAHLEASANWTCVGWTWNP